MDEGQAEKIEDGFEWAIVEVFGHRRHAGRAIEVERFGAKMLRIDIPKLIWPEGVGERDEPTQDGWTTHFYGGASIFSYTLTDEPTVMRMNRPYRSPSVYSLAAPDDEDSFEEPSF